MVPRRGTGCFRPTGRDGGLHPPFSFVLPKENAPCTVEEKNAGRGLWDAYGPNAPQKREVNSPEIWREAVTCTARRASGGRCGQKQPTYPLRRKGFYQPLAAADWQLKER